MIKTLLLLSVLSICVLTSAQPLSGLDNCKCDSSNFYFDVYNTGLDIKIKVDSAWRDYNVINTPFNYFEIDCYRVNFNNIGSKELVLKWKTSTYGSGGGGQEGGVQIWNLDNGTKIFDEINYYLSENFGRGEATPWYVSCEKKIKVMTNKIKVDTMTCTEERNKSEMTAKELMENESFNLTNLEGIYNYESGKLKKN